MYKDTFGMRIRPRSHLHPSDISLPITWALIQLDYLFVHVLNKYWGLGSLARNELFFFFSSLAFLSIPPQKGPASYRRPTPIYFNSPTIPTLAYSPSHIPSPPIPQFPIHLSARVSVLPSLPFFFLIPVASRVWNIIRLKNFRAFLLRGKS